MSRVLPANKLMKKNTTIMLIILAFIALLHFAFLYIFFMDRDAKQKNPPNPPALIPQPPEPTVAFPEKKNLNSKPAGSKSQPKKKPLLHQLTGPIYLIRNSMS